MTHDFYREINKARNSKEDLTLKTENELKIAGGNRRVSAAQLQTKLLHGKAAKENFTTIVPQGLPEDLIGDGEDDVVERQNVLVQPKGYKNEASRLPPYKPFKTVSDEDNIHLLPGETGERARQNLLDTKTVAKKDVEEVHTAYLRQRENYPELYGDAPAEQIKTEKEKPVKPPPQQPQTKKSFLKKIFGAKKEPDKPEEIKPQDPAKKTEKTPEKKVEKKPEKKPPGDRSRSKSKPKPGAKPPPPGAGRGRGRGMAKPQGRRIDIKRRGKKDKSDSDSSSSSSSSSSNDEEDPKANMAKMQMMQYYSMLKGGFPGMPGGYQHYGNPYPAGYGPMSVVRQPPICPPNCRGEEAKQRCKKLPPKQGLNFDFLPHDELATEVTMTIEPDEPEPLQFAVENGIMPIICCYMPNSLAVSQQQQQLTPQVSYAGYGYPPASQTQSTSLPSSMNSGSTGTPFGANMQSFSTF